MYCLPPLHHASGLLTTLGATVVGRSRIALSNGVDAETFAVEVRRYGITVVSYTWTMMREIVRSENFHIAEHNPIRLFIGSGMPVGLWEDVQAAFPRARVLEFFATADGSAILANVAGDQAGSMGRELPETNPVQVAAFDIENSRLEVAPNGFVRRATRGRSGCCWHAPAIDSTFPRPSCEMCSAATIAGKCPVTCSDAIPTATCGSWVLRTRRCARPTASCTSRRSRMRCPGSRCRPGRRLQRG